MKGLTQKQSKILNFIHSFIDQQGYSPSYREIMDHFSFNSMGTVYKYIRTLTKKGAIEYEKYSHRSVHPKNLVIQKEQSMEVQLSIIGNISPGYPLELFTTHKTIAISTSLVPCPENTYILQAQGNMLQTECIQDGDLLMIETKREAHDGEIILGLINQQDTVLKRFFAEGEFVRLENQNSKNDSLTIHRDHILIQGILVGLLRVFN